jgi:DNA-binding CsgD family transcriptional regulator
MQKLGPIGTERWPYELALQYGIRDALTCCVGQRWLVAYWSRQVLTNVLTEPLRLLLIAAAGFAAQRLEQVICANPRQVGNRPPITPRELAVLRLTSLGRTTNEVAELLGIGEETVRSHLKKVQAKLGVRNRAHAAAEGVRQQLIP